MTGLLALHGTPAGGEEGKAFSDFAGTAIGCVKECSEVVESLASHGFKRLQEVSSASHSERQICRLFFRVAVCISH